ncbi:MAG TPA: histidine kinase N-terminal 7TM domain-containing protein [Anaerolineales bacterium]|nr:histidine kinase N-terminal 7TM domain-containing protein [Anaerolineales bacterium]
MAYQFTPNMIPLAIAAMISAALAWYTWRHRHATGVMPFSLMMLILFQWGLSYILELAALDFKSKLAWATFMFAGVVSTPVAWLAFALEYTGRKAWLARNRILLLLVLPLITMGIILTNNSHGLFWASMDLAREGGFLLLKTTNGPWFWMHAAYSYILIMIGLVLIIRTLLKWPPSYRGQMIWILLATLTPLIANVITIFQLLPILIDLTPFAFTITGIGMAYALFRHRLLDIAPLARDVVIDGMKDGMLVLDAQRRIVDINRAAKEILGVAEDDKLIGRRIREVLTQWPHLLQNYRDVYEAEDEITLGDGESQRSYELNLSTLRDENQRTLGQVITIRDITRRKRTEILLQENEARFRQIVEYANDLIYRVDMNGCISYANPAVLRALGYEEQDVLGKHYLDLAVPEMRHRIKRTYEHQFLSKTPITYNEFPALATDGREIWFGQNVQLIFDGEKVVGFQSVARDITAIKEAQESLRLARDQALEASRAKSLLLSKVSHELRTPLGGILGYGELLRDDTFGELNDGQKKAVSQIVESSNYLTNMVNELLDEAQLSANTARLQEKPFSPVALLGQACSGMEVLAAKKGLQLKATVEDGIPQELVGDERRLRQIMINLLGNAIKFTREGGVSIRLLRPTSEHWAIQVQDTGVGIPKEAQAYIFEPFRQVHSAITRDNRGVGLGLSITKQLVDLMGGRITLESSLGKGSTFTIFLPINRGTGEKA